MKSVNLKAVVGILTAVSLVSGGAGGAAVTVYSTNTATRDYAESVRVEVADYLGSGGATNWFSTGTLSKNPGLTGTIPEEVKEEIVTAVIDSIDPSMMFSVVSSYSQVSDEKIKTLETKLNNKITEVLTTSTTELSSLQEEALIASITAIVESELLNTLAKYDSKIENKTQATEDALLANLDRVNSTLNQYNSELAKLNRDITDMSNTISNINSEAATTEEINSMLAAFDTLSSKYDTLSEQYTQVTADAGTLGNKLKTEVDNLRDTIDASSSDFAENLDNANQTLQDNILINCASISEVNGRVDELLSSLNQKAEDLQGAVDEEARLRTEALDAEEQERKAAIVQVNEDLSAEEQARIKAVSDEFNARKQAIEAEAKARKDAINKEIEDRSTAVGAEISARTNAINTVTTALNKEIEDRGEAVSAEASARAEAITQEVRDRNSAISVESSARAEAIAQEVRDRDAAIDAHKNNVKTTTDALNSDLTSEATTRTNEVTRLDERIDDLTASNIWVYPGDAKSSRPSNASDILSSGGCVFYKTTNDTTTGFTRYAVECNAIKATSDLSVNYAWGTGDSVSIYAYIVNNGELLITLQGAVVPSTFVIDSLEIHNE